MQEEALVGALSDILWRAGDRQHVVLCLTQENIYLTENPEFQADGCTERVRMEELGLVRVMGWVEGDEKM